MICYNLLFVVLNGLRPDGQTVVFSDFLLQFSIAVLLYEQEKNV